MTDPGKEWKGWGYGRPQQMSKSIDNLFALPNGKPIVVVFSNGLPPEGKILSMPYSTFKQAIYERLASEADLTWKKDGGDEEYISLSVLREVFGIK